MLPDSLAARGSCDTLLLLRLLRRMMKFARSSRDYLSPPNTVSVELLTSPLLPEILLLKAVVVWGEIWCSSSQFMTIWWRCWVWRDSQCHPVVESNPWDFLILAAVTTAWPLLGFLWWWPRCTPIDLPIDRYIWRPGMYHLKSSQPLPWVLIDNIY